ncbi:MAG: FAD-dependent oxidoreductase [Spirochaetales bacterium]|uniref:FAD-dependent oxidoreductase n=1 Tax=Candidatus Thalassospirochaeta sargassi TaxID=3119039 RepID=A0AAJ1MKF0_9SPIO|nr:FAD-dependent oxidoreductase [Spirochaetales bacterium]
MKLSDFRGIFKNNKIKLINKENPVGDYWVFDFEIPGGLTWTPGEHGLFSFPDKKITGKKSRSFSIASTPDEGVIKIGTKIIDKPSDFKDKLRAMNPGDHLKLRGPFGWFKLPKTKSKLLFLAGGIGITPIRALYKQIDSEKSEFETELFFVSDSHIFMNELESWGSSNTAFIESRDNFYRKLDEHLASSSRADYFYISGNPKLINQVTENLKKAGVKKSQIINDPFLGY